MRENSLYGWDKFLFVILYEITVEEYKQAREVDTRLPDLPSCVTVEEFSLSKRCKYFTWSDLYHSVKADMVENDKEHGAVDKWRVYLEDWARGKLGDGFPRANEVYSK